MTSGVGYLGTRDPNIAGVSSSGVSGSGVAAVLASSYTDTNVTWQPSPKGTYGTLSNGNLTLTSEVAATPSGVRATAAGKNTGKWYYECVLSGASVGQYIGLYVVGGGGISMDAFLGYSTETVGRNCSSTTIRSNGNKGTGGATAFSSGDIISVLYDPAATTITFWRNGVVSGTWTALPSGLWAPAMSGGNLAVDVTTARFKPSTWTYTPPAGYDSWQ